MKKFFAAIALCLSLSAHAQSGIDYSNGLVTAANALNQRRLRDHTADNYSAKDFGAICNGVADDSSAINAGLASLSSGGALILPAGCAIGSTINIPAGVTLRGYNIDQAAIKPLSGNLTMFNLAGNGAKLSDLQIDATGQTYTGGFLITVPNTVSNTFVDYIQINGGWSGVSVQGFTNTVANVNILAPGIGPGAVGFAIPAGANVFLFNTFVHGPSSGTQPEAAVKITGGGGHILYNVQGTYTGNGLEVMPSGAPVDWVWCDTCVFDNDSGDGFHLVASGPSSYIAGFYCARCWAGSNTGYGYYAEQDTGGVVNDLHLVAPQSMGNGKDGFYLSGISNVFIQNGSSCGNSTASAHTYNGVSAILVSNAVIQGNMLGDCGHFSSSTQNFGVSSSASKLSITGNTFFGNNASQTVILGVLPTNGVIRDNLGIDDVTPTVASASSIVTGVSTQISLTGTSAVSTIDNCWEGRRLTIIPTGASSVTTGGNIANAVSFSANVPHVAVCHSSNWNVQ